MLPSALENAVQTVLKMTVIPLMSIIFSIKLMTVCMKKNAVIIQNKTGILLSILSEPPAPQLHTSLS